MAAHDSSKLKGRVTAKPVIGKDGERSSHAQLEAMWRN